MTKATPARTLKGRRVLLVEDEYMIAEDMAQTLNSQGVKVVGPVASVDDALRLLSEAEIDLAILDVNLGGEAVWPLADTLRARDIRFVLTTGYDRSALPTRYADAPRCEKPVDLALLTATLLRLGDG